MNRIARNRKFKEERKSILNTNIDLFGKQLEYKKGDIVIWKGQNPAILRIERDLKVNPNGPSMYNCAKSTHINYDSLHYSNLRIATFREFKYLGSSEFRLIK
jgi:hypothetical protein